MLLKSGNTERSQLSGSSHSFIVYLCGFSHIFRFNFIPLPVHLFLSFSLSQWLDRLSNGYLQWRLCGDRFLLLPYSKCSHNIYKCICSGIFSINLFFRIREAISDSHYFPIILFTAHEQNRNLFAYRLAFQSNAMNFSMAWYEIMD